MCSTAGADICSREGYDTHLPVQFLLTAVFNTLYRFFVVYLNICNAIVPDNLIGFILNLTKLIHRKLTAQIDGDEITSHVETNILIPVLFMNETTDNMFSGMILHHVKPILPVDPSVNFGSFLQRLIRIVPNLAVLLMCIQNSDFFRPVLSRFRVLNYPAIPRLTAAFRIKCGTVKHNLITFPNLLTGYHRSIKLTAVSIFIINFFCHNRHSYLEYSYRS